MVKSYIKTNFNIHFLEMIKYCFSISLFYFLILKDFTNILEILNATHLLLCIYEIIVPILKNVSHFDMYMSIL